MKPANNRSLQYRLTSLPLDVVFLVLLGALLHAGWNALIKAGPDKSLDATLIAGGAAIVSLPLIGFVPLPQPEAWRYLVVSAILQFAYFRLIAATYAVADMGLAYPLMRGCAPLIVASTSGIILQEHLSNGSAFGILVISAGILSLLLEARGRSGKGAVLAIGNACVIAAYTFVDAVGMRLSGSAISYTLWMSFLPALMLFAWSVYSRSLKPVLCHLRTEWWRGLIGGGGSIASYGLALWAMTKAPVATVAALRESSIVFALLIAVMVLKEPTSRVRLLAAAIIAGGGVILKFG